MHETYTLRFFQHDGPDEERLSVTVTSKDQLKQRIRELWDMELRAERFDEVEVT